ncbi:hypothetical protein DSL72_001480 [Monilinia vaccinii-corymbosi]|uniref:Oxidoreductase n=1 Tax=Monilinia vaccinii-corymbosi TaxID=61207 RepID=A0A8A3P7T9_9HELO|nr:hypothetical protein DSL72_001480 [Monilinia vaccinii-corymbosi]
MLSGLLGLGGVSFEPEKDIPNLAGKVILVTGGNVGLGLETILQLSRHNPSHIYLAARSESKANAAIEEVQSKVPDAPITFLQCDLASLPSVQECAKQFDNKESRLDLLFLNAGIMAVPAATTEQGYEIQFGTNHVGHALLTKLLLPKLLKTAEQKDADVRVISLSSLGHKLSPAGGIKFDDLKTDMNSYLTGSRYGQSKLSNILFTKGLDKRYGERGITAVSVHPGVVNTNLYATPLKQLGVFGKIGGLVRDLAFTSLADGAKNQLWAAVANKGNAKGEVLRGEYYMPVGISGTGSNYTGDEKLADKLWEWTEKELEGYDI